MQSSYEYYEEVEEIEVEALGNAPATTTGAKTIVIENQKDLNERKKKYILYFATISEFYRLLSMDDKILGNFKTTARLLKFFYLTQLINSPDEEHQEMGIKFALLLYRCDSNTRLTDISKDAVALETL